MPDDAVLQEGQEAAVGPLVVGDVDGMPPISTAP